MKSQFKRPRVKLDRESYGLLQRQVLERDSWRCQDCGTSRHLQVHHRQFRSHAGNDEEGNLITLCAACHSRIHSRH